MSHRNGQLWTLECFFIIQRGPRDLLIFTNLDLKNSNSEYLYYLDIDDVSDIEEIDDPVEPIHSIENIVSESPEPKHKIVRPGFTDFTRFEQDRTSNRPSNTEYGSIERLRNMQHNISFAPQVK